ncbi:MAG: hypothetical protein QMC83_10135, partial [Thermodesulfovibrionales bacterium]|nr:hypothetical protein [Thermodesulfovibrionales bacterium]
LGEKIYSPDKDLDLGNDKLTIFGVRWLHYLWILPFIFYPFLASVIIIIYGLRIEGQTFKIHFRKVLHATADNKRACRKTHRMSLWTRFRVS